MTSSRVLLTTLSVRTSAKGRQYLSGWLGKASVVAFTGQPDKFGNPTWDVFLSEPELKRDAAPKAAASPPERDEAPTPPGAAPAAAGARPDGPRRRFRREGEAARRERVAGEVATAYGLGARDPDDPIPF
jgi:hypothetical protein